MKILSWSQMKINKIYQDATPVMTKIHCESEKDNNWKS